MNELFEPLPKVMRFRVVSLDRLAVMEEATAEMARNYQECARLTHSEIEAGRWDHSFKIAEWARRMDARRARRYLFALIGDGRGEE